MKKQLILNPASGEWEEIELDEAGFPKTEERLISVNAVTGDAVDIQALTKDCDDARQSNPMPEHFEGGMFDCSSNTWTEIKKPKMSDIYPSDEQQWPSWTEGDDGKWYAPLSPPEDGRMYFWDETDNSWFNPQPTS